MSSKRIKVSVLNEFCRAEKVLVEAVETREAASRVPVQADSALGVPEGVGTEVASLRPMLQA
jgi:hypothetical protein